MVTRIGRPLLVGACLTFGIGAIALEMVARQQPDMNAALALAVPLFVLGLGAGGVITPNQTLTLIEVDPVTGGNAGGVFQESKRIGGQLFHRDGGTQLGDEVEVLPHLAVRRCGLQPAIPLDVSRAGHTGS